MGLDASREDDDECTIEPSDISTLAEASPAIDLSEIREILRARRLRGNFIGKKIFADPAWDILLSLLTSEIASVEMPVTALCEAAAVPPTTALRWIQQMTDWGLLIRREDPFDKRRAFIALAPETSQSLRRYFHTIRARPI